MLLAFIVSTSIALSVANPLHKYPYVFLLDVGNEELQRTNTEQLRISIPGGSLSMKYPSMGEGDPITHVRVSGIDFGTDLKVNILQGGPGYRYVVLMFVGNPGVTYDAVVTLQTLHMEPSGTEKNVVDTSEIISTENFTPNSYEVSDANSDDYDQDAVKGSKNMKQFSKKAKEETQATSIFYNYLKGKLANSNSEKESQNVSSEEQDDNDESEDEQDETDSDASNEGEHEDSNEDEPEVSDKEHRISDVHEEENESGERTETKGDRGQSYSRFNDNPRAVQYRYNVDSNDSDDDKSVDAIDDGLYDKYQALKPHFGIRVYPQSFIYNKPYQVNSAYNKEDPAEFEQMFNDEEVHNDARFKDGSNSIDDSDYPVAEY